uniref:Large ribosomal subunit protein uL29 n=1 Tax='Vitis vinifera' yellows phytoplasma TaxID=1203288 RepID=I6ULY9_9MOLU|nr:ribosomal protein L29 ['Vitis vinifera' yellows phytoplasma]
MMIKEIRKMSVDEMNKKIINLKEELFDAKLNLNLVKLKDTSRIRKIKKNIRQIKTIIREKEMSKINNKNESLVSVVSNE